MMFHQVNGDLHDLPCFPSLAGHCCSDCPHMTTQWILRSGDNTALLPSEAANERISPETHFCVSSGSSEATIDVCSPSQEASPL